METELKCNRLACRKPLTDKAVVTTCSHIFCVECTNELFTAARLCPACDTTLNEPDDIVICSLHPSNDYKTSVLSGLGPSTILEICSRAISFWQYQNFQENSFQLAVVRNLNDRTAQLQTQLENVIREANSEISLLGNKTADLERDLELERRKSRELQNASREREKEYQKLKMLHDKFKRKALLGPHPGGSGVNFTGQANDGPQNNQRVFEASPVNSNFGLHAVGGIEVNGIQRTPVIGRTSGFSPQGQVQQTYSTATWEQQQQPHQTYLGRKSSKRQPFTTMTDRSYRSTTDQSEGSANEVENLLVNDRNTRGPSLNGGWVANTPLQPFRSSQPAVQGFNANTAVRRTGSKFRPAGGMMR